MSELIWLWLITQNRHLQYDRFEMVGMLDVDSGLILEV